MQHPPLGFCRTGGLSYRFTVMYSSFLVAVSKAGLQSTCHELQSSKNFACPFRGAASDRHLLATSSWICMANPLRCYCNMARLTLSVGHSKRGTECKGHMQAANVLIPHEWQSGKEYFHRTCRDYSAENRNLSSKISGIEFAHEAPCISTSFFEMTYTLNTSLKSYRSVRLIAFQVETIKLSCKSVQGLIEDL